MIVNYYYRILLVPGTRYITLHCYRYTPLTNTQHGAYFYIVRTVIRVLLMCQRPQNSCHLEWAIIEWSRASLLELSRIPLYRSPNWHPPFIWVAMDPSSVNCWTCLCPLKYKSSWLTYTTAAAATHCWERWVDLSQQLNDAQAQPNPSGQKQLDDLQQQLQQLTVERDDLSQQLNDAQVQTNPSGTLHLCLHLPPCQLLRCLRSNSHHT